MYKKYLIKNFSVRPSPIPKFKVEYITKSNDELVYHTFYLLDLSCIFH